MLVLVKPCPGPLPVMSPPPPLAIGPTVEHMGRHTVCIRTLLNNHDQMTHATSPWGVGGACAHPPPCGGPPRPIGGRPLKRLVARVIDYDIVTFSLQNVDLLSVTRATDVSPALHKQSPCGFLRPGGRTQWVVLSAPAAKNRVEIACGGPESRSSQAPTAVGGTSAS